LHQVGTSSYLVVEYLLFSAPKCFSCRLWQSFGSYKLRSFLRHISHENAICHKLIIRGTAIPALLDVWVTNTPSVEILCS